MLIIQDLVKNFLKKQVFVNFIYRDFLTTAYSHEIEKLMSHLVAVICE